MTNKFRILSTFLASSLLGYQLFFYRPANNGPVKDKNRGETLAAITGIDSVIKAYILDLFHKICNSRWTQITKVGQTNDRNPGT